MMAAPRPVSKSDSTQVLIVGAGPAGLMLASELQRFGVEHRIVDRLEAPTGQSRATDLQPRSLEILARCGALARVEERGSPVHAINIYSGPQRICRMTFAALESRYPHMLASSQADTEQALAEHYTYLGGVVERGVELLALEQGEDGATARLRGPRGDEEVVRCAWVVGCDGAHSRVRALLGVSFPGSTYPEHHMLADARVTWGIAKDELHGFLAESGHLLVLALPGPDQYRLFVDVDPDEEREPSLETFRALLAERVPVPATIHEVTWSSRFRQHRRQVDRYRVGRAFLVGDAAHIHSIIPGQGLNLAIQDAFNLGWKLALVVRGFASAELLDSYHAERHPIGRLTLRLTHVFHSTLVLRRRVARWLRDRLMPRTMAIRALHDQASALCAELSHNYRGSPVVGQERRRWPLRGRLRGGPRPGDRAPDHRLADGRWFSGGVSGLEHSLLLFAGDAALDAERRRRLRALAEEITARVGAPIEARVVVPGDAGEGEVADVGGALHRRYGAARGGLFLVRPDGYVAFRGPSLDARPLLAHLRERAALGVA